MTRFTARPSHSAHGESEASDADTLAAESRIYDVSAIGGASVVVLALAPPVGALIPSDKAGPDSVSGGSSLVVPQLGQLDPQDS